MPSFGKRSQKNLATCCNEWQHILNTAITVYDFSLVCGFRPEAVQNKLFEIGASKLRWPNGKHNRNPSDAVDIYPYVRTIKGVKVNTTLTGNPKQTRQLAKKVGISLSAMKAYIMEEFAKMMGVIRGVAAAYGITIRCGDDWDSDGDRLDQKFNDLCHAEIVR